MISSFAESIKHFLVSHHHVASIATFALAFSESLPVVGLVIPGTTLIVLLATLVPSGILKLEPLLLSAVLGAIAGDAFAYTLGRRYQREILGVWPLSRYPELVERSEQFFRRHGGKSVFLARFTPAVRAFVPLFAGMLNMPAVRFYTANTVSALFWATAHILPGVFAGAAFARFGVAAKPIAALLILLGVGGWLMLRLVRYAVRRGEVLLPLGAERLRNRLASGNGRFSRTFAKMLERNETGTLLGLTVLFAGAAGLFLKILEDVVTGDSLVLADQAIRQALQSLRTAPGDAAMIAITELGDPAVVVAVTASVALWLAWKRSWRSLRYWIVAVAGASALNTAIKVALHRPRPNELLYSGWSAFSFPSGHSTVNLVLYGFLAFLITRTIRPARRLPFFLAASTLAFLIAFSRLYLGAHWFSDVAGGLAFGSLWIALLCLSWMRRPYAPVASRGLIAAGCAALLFAGSLQILSRHTADVARYAVRDTPPSLSAEEWWTSGWSRLPERRIAVTGRVKEPVAFQWAGNLQHLEELLQRQNWNRPAPWTFQNALVWFTNAKAPGLPVIPFPASGLLPALILVRPVDGASSADVRLVLRLWPADCSLSCGDEIAPLWIGSVVEERLRRPFGWFTLTQTQTDMEMPLRVLSEAFELELSVLRFRASQREWSGEVLLARDCTRPQRRAIVEPKLSEEDS